MILAVKLYQHVDNPHGIPGDWPARVVELGDNDPQPEGYPLRMTPQELRDYQEARRAAYDAWEQAYLLSNPQQVDPPSNIGPKGDTGPKGDVGERGLQGLAGDTGDPGERGLPGESIMGEKGDKGDQGIQGLKGDTGERGLTGLKGDQGLPGLKGDKGDQGLQGLTGLQGLAGLNSHRALITLSADVSSAAVTTFANIGNLAFPVLALVNYRFYALIVYTASAATIGLRVSLTGPASPALLAYSTRTGLSATGSAAAEWSNYQTTYDAGTVSTSSVATTAGNLLIMEGFIRPTLAGTVQLRFAPETATAGGTVIRAGSTLEVW